MRAEYIRLFEQMINKGSFPMIYMRYYSNVPYFLIVFILDLFFFGGVLLSLRFLFGFSFFFLR